MTALDEITKEKQRITAALARVDNQRKMLVSQLSELEAAERVLARYSTGRPARRTASANPPTMAIQAVAPARQRGRRRTTTAMRLVELERSDPRSGIRQDAAGNRRCLQGCSPEPLRRRDCPAQAGWPHRRA